MSTTQFAAGKKVSLPVHIWNIQRKPAWGVLVTIDAVGVATATGADEAVTPSHSHDGTVQRGGVKAAAERKRTGRLGDDKRFKLFSGSANRALAEQIAKHVGVTLGETKTQRFADGEVY